MPPLVTLQREGPGRREAPRDTCARAPCRLPLPRPVPRARATAAAAPRGGWGCVPRPRLGWAPDPPPPQPGGRPLPRAASPRPGPLFSPADADDDVHGASGSRTARFLRPVPEGRGGGTGMGTRRLRYRPPTCLSRDPGKGGREGLEKEEKVERGETQRQLPGNAMVGGGGSSSRASPRRTRALRKGRPAPAAWGFPSRSCAPIGQLPPPPQPMGRAQRGRLTAIG